MKRATPIVLLLLSLVAGACGGGQEPSPGALRCPTRDLTIGSPSATADATKVPDAGEITVYSGRSEKLVGPLLKRFTVETGIEVKARYGDTAELASTILEEGPNSPADVFFAQDAGALGALRGKGRFSPLPSSVLARVAAKFRATDGTWIGISGRVRVIAYDCTKHADDQVPDSVLELTDSAWKGRVGWAPTNGSFQAFVSGMRKLKGDSATKTWLEDMKANGAVTYPNNDSIAESIAEGEIELGLLNHYYPYEIREEIPDAHVEAHFLAGGDPGGLVNVAGLGILNTSKNEEQAQRFVAFLLSDASQEYFRDHTFEYPLVAGLKPFAGLPALDALEAPVLDLSELSDLEGTLDLLRAVGLL